MNAIVINYFNAFKSRKPPKELDEYRSALLRRFLRAAAQRYFLKANLRQWIVALALPLLVLGGLPALAADYTFQGASSPSGCTGSNGNFTCVTLRLDKGDTLSISSPTTITVLGALTTGASSRINPSGSFGLNLLVIGLTDLGADTVVRANLNSAAGVVTIGPRSSFTGSINTNTAAVNIGINSTVTGSIITTAGAVTTNTGSFVTGDISTTLGVVTIASKVGGKINSLGVNLAGAVTVISGGVIDGFIITGAGAVTVGVGSSTGGIATNAGAITVLSDSNVRGSLCTGIAGAITVGSRTVVSGNVVSKAAGAITIGALARVAGAVTVVSAGALTIANGAIVGTSANSSQCANVAPVVTPPAALPPTIKSREWRQIFMR